MRCVNNEIDWHYVEGEAAVSEMVDPDTGGLEFEGIKEEGGRGEGEAAGTIPGWY